MILVQGVKESLDTAAASDSGRIVRLQATVQATSSPTVGYAKVAIHADTVSKYGVEVRSADTVSRYFGTCRRHVYMVL